MKPNVVETVKACFTDHVLGQLSAATADDRTGVEQTVDRLVPLVLNTLLGRAERAGGTEALWRLTQEAQSLDVLAQLPHLKDTRWGTRGTELLQALLGEAHGSTLHRLAESAGVQPAAVSPLANVVVAATLGVLAEHARRAEMDADRLTAWLATQAGHIRAALLPNLFAARANKASGPVSALNYVGAPAPAAGTWATVGGGTAFTPAAPADRHKISQQWIWALGLLVAVGLGSVVVHNQLIAPVRPAPQATARPAVPDTMARTGRGHFDKDRGTYTYVDGTGQPIILALANSPDEGEPAPAAGRPVSVSGASSPTQQGSRAHTNSSSNKKSQLRRPVARKSGFKKFFQRLGKTMRLDRQSRQQAAAQAEHRTRAKRQPN